MKLLDIPIGLLINFHELKLTNGVHRFILAGANNVGEIEQVANGGNGGILS